MSMLIFYQILSFAKLFLIGLVVITLFLIEFHADILAMLLQYVALFSVLCTGLLAVAVRGSVQCALYGTVGCST